MHPRMVQSLWRRVSLFTREWIEMSATACNFFSCSVSLFTREWIEIHRPYTAICIVRVSLFTREWIEML